MMSKQLPVLYSYWRSSCSWRVRIALNLKGINFITKPVDLVKKEQYSKEFLEHSPFGFVPALITEDGTFLNESLAIIEYLEEKYPNSKTLLPGSIEDRAKIRSISLQIIANLQPLQNLKVILYVSEDQAKRNDWAHHWIQIIFERLEKVLQNTAGKYAYGNELSLIDVCIPPQVYNAKRFNVDLTPFPTIVRLNETLAQIPEFIAADSRNQPDTPVSEK